VARYRHYENTKEPGVTLFVTTTVLDFVHAFHRAEVRDAMVSALAFECKRGGATLYGYVVMPHHIHMVIRLAEKMNGPQFMRVFKKKSGESITKLLGEDELRQFDQQRGLNGNTFWQRSFRSLLIESRDVFWQKMNYIHLNPVRAGHVEQAEDYRWSSARLVMEGKMSDEAGIPYHEVLASVQPRGGSVSCRAHTDSLGALSFGSCYGLGDWRVTRGIQTMNGAPWEGRPNAR
jgi:REP element-mobilizing transposase RayT